MTAKEAIKNVLDSNMNILKMFLADLSDADLLVRPIPNANHAAWQLGHLIAAESRLLASIDGIPAKLPDGFAEKHTPETAKDDSPASFLKKDEYLKLLDEVRAATLASLDKLSDAALDTKTTGPMAAFAPNYGSLYILLGNHTMMHAGQFTVLRRKLGKPVLF